MMSKNEPLLFIIGSSHEQANLEERETFSLKEEEVDLLADDLMNHQSIDECLVLNTCNRLEIYAVSNQAHPINEIHQFICSHPSLTNTHSQSLISLKRKRMPLSIPLSYPLDWLLK